MSVRLEIKSLESKLTPLQITPEVTGCWEYLDMTLSYEIQNAFFMQVNSQNQWIREHWDGKQHLFSMKSGKFLTGLLPQVLDALQQFNVPVETIDYRPSYEKGEGHKLQGAEVRAYQLEALTELLTQKRGILFARPRSGKTLIEIMLVAKLDMYPVLSICQSIDVAKQTIDKFNMFLPGVEVGLIGDGECAIKPVTVATIQSLTAAYNLKDYIPAKKKERTPLEQKKAEIIELVETAKVVWVDECHHSASGTHEYILRNKVYSAEYIVGCSGTPFREDNTNLLMQGLLGPIVYEINYSKLIDAGFLVRPTIHMFKLPETVATAGDQYQTVYSKAIVNNKLRNDVISKVSVDLTNRDKSVMILVSKINHGKMLQKLIPGSKFSHGNSSDRLQLWHQLKVKKIKCLITTLGDEGVDIPSLDAVIIAAGGESAIKVYQRMRCLTPYDGKEHAIVVDFLDPYPYLKTHSKKRMKLYRQEPSFRVTTKEVPLTI
jgi:superfamily II DNA or RNA helicase